MSFIDYQKLNSLEKFSFIAGNTYELDFTVYQEDGLSALDLGGATIEWVLCPYGQPDYVVAQISGTITGINTFKIDVPSASTASLAGTYIQQIIITSFSGDVYKPGQGVVIILPAIPYE